MKQKILSERISSSERGSFVRETKDGVELSEDEAGFIAFHFVNSQQGNEDMQVTMTATTMVRDILSIISKFFGIVFDEESLNYQRIITHLQFCPALSQREGSDEQDEFLRISSRKVSKSVSLCRTDQ